MKNMKKNMNMNMTTSSSSKQQLIDLFAQRLLIDRIHVKQVTDDADMLRVKEALVKAKEFDSFVIHSRDTDVFIALLHHLDGDILKNVIMETKKALFSLVKKTEQLSSEMRGCAYHSHTPFQDATLSQRRKDLES